MVAGQSVYEKYTPYKDGIITSVSTFQKYYTQTEFTHYLRTPWKPMPLRLGGAYLSSSKISRRSSVFYWRDKQSNVIGTGSHENGVHSSGCVCCHRV